MTGPAPDSADSDAALLALLPEAASFALAPVSGFRVGAVARGLSGRLYRGANLEFAGEALGLSLHAEQAAIAGAWAAGEIGIDLLAVSAAPCGHCRQFMAELTTAATLRILAGTASPTTLAALLPDAFGPASLGKTEGLMAPCFARLALIEASVDPLARAALDAAARSYAPYTGHRAGAALAMRDGRIFMGAYAENAAFNPSLPPMTAALSALAMAGGSTAEIAAAILVETAGGPSQAGPAAAVLRALGGPPPRRLLAG